MARKTDHKGNLTQVLLLELLLSLWVFIVSGTLSGMWLGTLLGIMVVLELMRRKSWTKQRIKVPSTRIKTTLLARILPEDYRADLNSLRHRWIVKQKLPKWLVNIRTYLFLLVVFKGWLQIKCENIFLPNNRRS